MDFCPALNSFFVSPFGFSKILLKNNTPFWDDFVKLECFIIYGFNFVMKKQLKTIPYFLLIAFLLGCNSKGHETAIYLNNGEKWKINAEMKPHLDEGNRILTAFISGKEFDFKKLADDMKIQNNSLIQSCTMKGEPHDVLHLWLIPHMEIVDQLSKATTPEEANELIIQLKDSYRTFQFYFE